MKPLSILSLLLGSLTWLPAQTTISFQQDGQMLSVEERMAQEQTQGVALFVMLDGAIILDEQWGWRDREAQLPVNEHTVFQIGSMSQPLVHLVVLRLVDQGLFDLDADINTYLRSWQFPSNKITVQRPITIRDLLLQRRGFKFPYKPDGFAAGEVLPTHLQLLRGEKPAQNPAVQLHKDLNKKGNNSFAPALILQQLLMDHYQLPFADLMRRELFDPLGMQYSFFTAEPSSQQQENLAIGYTDKNQQIPNGFLRFPELAASGAYTTAHDYGLFVQALLDAFNGKEDAVLSPELAREALQPEASKDVLLFGRGQEKYYWGGATKGYYCQFDADAQDHRWVVVAFTNDNLNWSFNTELRNKGAELAKKN